MILANKALQQHTYNKLATGAFYTMKFIRPTLQLPGQVYVTTDQRFQ